MTTHGIVEEEEQKNRYFFAALHRKSSSKDKEGKEQVDAMLDMPLAKSLPTKDSFLSKAFQQLFLRPTYTKKHKKNTRKQSCRIFLGNRCKLWVSNIELGY